MSVSKFKMKQADTADAQADAQGRRGLVDHAVSRREDLIKAGMTSENLGRSRAALWVSLLCMASFAGWASWAEIDQVTRGTASVIASSKTQVIQSVEGGVVAALLVKEGDEVSKGQVLARLDTTKSQASLQEVESKRASLGASIARLRAEVLGTELVMPRNLLVSHPAICAAQVALYQRRIAALNEELKGMRGLLSVAREELLINEKLLERGDVPIGEVLKLRRSVMELEANIANRSNKYFQESQQELAKAEEELASASQIATQRSDTLKNTELLAPVNGVVKNVRVTTLGGVLRPGEEMMQIVPAEDSLIVEAKIKPADIAFVRAGAPASIKIDAYDYSKYGALNGEVVYISADTLQDEQRAQPGQEPTFYRVHVRTKGRVFQKRPDEQLEIIPGMTATIEVRTGTNTVMNYLLKPLKKTLSESMTER